jgi:hypothetical protein
MGLKLGACDGGGGVDLRVVELSPVAQPLLHWTILLIRYGLSE